MFFSKSNPQTKSVPDLQQESRKAGFCQQCSVRIILSHGKGHLSTVPLWNDSWMKSGEAREWITRHKTLRPSTISTLGNINRREIKRWDLRLTTKHEETAPHVQDIAQTTTDTRRQVTYQGNKRSDVT